MYGKHTSFWNPIQHRCFPIVRAFYSCEIELFYELVHYYGVNKGRSIRVNQNMNRGNRELLLLWMRLCVNYYSMFHIVVRLFSNGLDSHFYWELSCKQTSTELFCCYPDWHGQVFTARWMWVCFWEGFCMSQANSSTWPQAKLICK